MFVSTNRLLPFISDGALKFNGINRQFDGPHEVHYANTCRGSPPTHLSYRGLFYGSYGPLAFWF